jgi:hypothetical protein
MPGLISRPGKTSTSPIDEKQSFTNGIFASAIIFIIISPLQITDLELSILVKNRPNCTQIPYLQQAATRSVFQKNLTG